MVLAEGVAEDLEVLEVGVVGVGVELDARHGQVEEDAVVDLAEGGAVEGGCEWAWELYGMIGFLPRPALLDLRHVELQQAVQPSQQLLPGDALLSVWCGRMMDWVMM